jgi:Ca2+-transporting ATPase
MVLANDADPSSQAGDPLDLALLRHAAPAVDPETLRAAHPRRSHRPFDPVTRSMRVSVTEDGGAVSYFKGAPEVLLARCALADDDRRTWLEKTGAYAAEGFRLLALAWGEGESEDALHWLGVVLLWDPPRPEVPEAVRRARDAGIRILIITGDHPGTAVTVARVAGLEHRTVVTGAEWHALSPDAQRRAVRETHVFARVTPEQKLRIVETLQAEGEIVAVTGDGVNDAPALKRANVGVAMGQRGSDVSREVADIVLLDDNFATIVAAVEEGRGIFENIQKSIRFLFSTNLSELLLVTVGALTAALLDLRGAGGGLLLPLTAAQLLWINLVTDGAPALALGLDRTPDVMRRRPRDPAAPLLDRRSLRFIVLSGVVKAVLAFGILGLLPRFGQSLAVTATATFLFISAGQVLFAYPARHTDVRPRANRALLAAVVVSLAVQPLLVVAPVFRSAFGTVALPAVVWVVVVGITLVSWTLAEAVSWRVWSRGEMKPG